MSNASPSPSLSLRIDGYDTPVWDIEDAQWELDHADFYPSHRTYRVKGYVVDASDEVVAEIERIIHPEPVTDGWEVVASEAVYGKGGGFCWYETRRSPQGREARILGTTWYEDRANGEIIGGGYVVEDEDEDEDECAVAPR